VLPEFPIPDGGRDAASAFLERPSELFFLFDHFEPCGGFRPSCRGRTAGLGPGGFALELFAVGRLPVAGGGASSSLVSSNAGGVEGTGDVSRNHIDHPYISNQLAES
jgi:hypothetical protein